MNIMMPVALILCGIGTTRTGITIKDKLLTLCSIPSLIVGIYMIAMIANDNYAWYIWWALVFGVCFIIMMFIPGLVLYLKEKKENV